MFFKSLITYGANAGWCDPAWDIKPRFRTEEYPGDGVVKSQEHEQAKTVSVPAIEGGGATSQPVAPLSQPSASVCNVTQPSATNCNDLQNLTKEENALFGLLLLGGWDNRTMVERGAAWDVNASTASRWIKEWSEKGLIVTQRVKRRVGIKLVETGKDVK